MAKKSTHARKQSGAAAIQTVDDELDREVDDAQHESNGHSTESDAVATKPKRGAKPKAEQPSDEHFGVGDVKKAAAFVNAIGGLDKAIAVLQILKVAKEVQ
jgi:hypothetical protein